MWEERIRLRVHKKNDIGRFVGADTHTEDHTGLHAGAVEYFLKEVCMVESPQL